MASDTPLSLRQSVVYSVFVRNYSEEGTFEAVRRDVARIRGLGTDIIWLMPIHPIGEAHRKGSLGSPYAIRDYRDVNPEFGTKEDFRALVDAIHEAGMRVIIDVVYNHTSPDSVLAAEHPEWFYHKADGSLGNKTGDWWDVVDLDYSNRALWDYQIGTLTMWAGDYGVDGFRCDVASMVPVAFWKTARQAVGKVRPGAIWLAESVEPRFVAWNRSSHIPCASDAELFQAFDMSYEYDVHDAFQAYLTGRGTLQAYCDALNRQETMYPANYCKLRFLENHDQLRARFLIPDEKALRNWTAFNYFKKGATLVYNGQEAAAAHTPTLFDKDPVDWDGGEEGEALARLMRRMAKVKKDPILADSTFRAFAAPHDVLVAEHTANAAEPNGPTGGRLVGVFPTDGRPSLLDASGAGGGIAIPDGRYENLCGGPAAEVDRGRLSLTGEPVVIRL